MLGTVPGMKGGRDLYIMQMAVTGDVKIGRSSDIDRRMGEIQTGCPHMVRVILRGPELGHQEQDLHKRLRRYKTKRRGGEWFTEDCLGELPDRIYNLFTVEVLEDPDWWKDPKWTSRW